VVKKYRQDVIGPIIDDIVSALVPNRPVAVVPDITSRIPFRLMCHLMGLPDAEAPWL
jgi:cytochrome P450